MIVMDTCAILWDGLQPQKISKKAKKAIEQADKNKSLIFCSISFWEIAQLIQLDRVKVDCDYQELIELLTHSRHYSIADLTPEISEIATTLPHTINKDPADRIIAATALAQKATLITADKNLRKSKLIETIW